MSVRSATSSSSTPNPFQEFSPMIKRIEDQLDHHTAALHQLSVGDLDPSSEKMRNLNKAMFALNKNVKMLAINAASCTQLPPPEKAGLTNIIDRLKNRVQGVVALRGFRIKELSALQEDPRIQLRERMPALVRNALAPFIVPVDYAVEIQATQKMLQVARRTAEKSLSEDRETLARLVRERSGERSEFFGFFATMAKNNPTSSLDMLAVCTRLSDSMENIDAVQQRYQEDAAKLQATLQAQVEKLNQDRMCGTITPQEHAEDEPSLQRSFNMKLFELTERLRLEVHGLSDTQKKAVEQSATLVGRHNKECEIELRALLRRITFLEEQMNTVRQRSQETGIKLYHILQHANEHLSALESEREAEFLRDRQIAEIREKREADQIATDRLLSTNEQLLVEKRRTIEELEAILSQRKVTHKQRAYGLVEVMRGATNKIDALEQTYNAEAAAITIKRLDALAAVEKSSRDNKNAKVKLSETQETIRTITRESNEKLEILTTRHRAIVDKCQAMRIRAEDDFQNIETSFVEESDRLEASIARLRAETHELECQNAEIREKQASAARETERAPTSPPLPPYYRRAGISGAAVSLRST